MKRRHFTIHAALCALALLAGPAFADEPLWQRLREGGAVVLLRHARAPGTGDPAGFKLGDCSTQRNLSREGQAQARALGEAFRRQQVPVVRVLSSQWCRALDTARLAFGQAEPEPVLNSFFAGRGNEVPQTAGLRQLVARWASSGVLVLVTHQVNITALTEIFPAEGEVVVLQPDATGFKVVGRLTP